MSLHKSLADYLGAIDTKFLAVLGDKGGYITFSNSGKGGDKQSFVITLATLLSSFHDFNNDISKFSVHQNYTEKPWRALAADFSDLAMRSIFKVQTKGAFTTISKVVGWANNLPSRDYQDERIEITQESIANTLDKLTKLVNCYAPKEIYLKPKIEASNSSILPKPFLLLAGISGTGKTRFVREQAAAQNKGDSNYCLIPVRPDWHEPSDLLGYISRIGLEGPCYVVTKLLVFIVAAWQNAFFSVEENKLICKQAAEMTPYWLCLDEMNLAPVEQYFADYLSVLETRKWENEEYSCDPLLVSDTIKLLNADMPDIGQEKLRKDLKLIGEENDALWAYFLNNGISIPPNLIVAGTVNMDETTHGFSRKVIDRAFTIDFGVFYPNDYGHYFESPIRHKTLSFPLLSQISKEDLSVVSADTDGQNSIDFLTAINTVLKGTPFELAYRALNELLLAVVSFAPENKLELQAVWDDFLMTKVLPRIDGDTEKLSNSVDDNSSDILSALLDVIEISFKEILINQRLDLLRENKDEKENPLMIPCRSKQKLEWMKARLTLNGFTTFWP